jgi:hypothetical protein
VNASAEPFTIGAPLEPPANECGPKDTVRVNPGEITRILVPFTDIRFPTDKPYLSVDRTRIIQGYVWQCHVEDNEMMQRYRVLDGRPVRKAPDRSNGSGPDLEKPLPDPEKSPPPPPD